MSLKVKICGVTTESCVAAAVDAGASAIGFVFAESPRKLSLERAAELAGAVPETVERVAVLRNPELGQVGSVLDRFAPDTIQSEPVPGLVELVAGRAEFVCVVHDGPTLEQDVATHRATRFGDRPLLLEAAGRGGRGVAPSWERARELARSVPLVLAGGLSPDNVARAIESVRPFGVDVSSGVESAPGVKDPFRIADFVARAREAAAAFHGGA